MNANELRIGNLVGEYVQIRSCAPKTLAGTRRITDKDFKDVSDFEPIPLTPEILEKCGFEKDNEDDSFDIHINNKQNVIRIKIGEWLMILDEEGCEAAAIHKDAFQHLHQLQNLYFALTGEELAVNL